MAVILSVTLWRRLKDPAMTKEQLKSKQSQLMIAVSSALGIAIGCVLGMFPLLFKVVLSECSVGDQTRPHRRRSLGIR